MRTKKPIQLDDFHAHEAMDRLHVVLSMIDDHLLTHPFIENRPELLRLVGAASKELADAYQAVAREHMP